MSQKKKGHSVVSFQEDWLTKEEFKSWLRKVEVKHQTLQMENHQPYRLIRKEKRELVMKRNENKIGILFKKKSADSTATAANEVQMVGTCGKPFVVPEEVLDAEISWCLRLVHSHQSYRSCNLLPTVFQRMFNSCPVAEQFPMQKDKARYNPALKAK